MSARPSTPSRSNRNYPLRVARARKSATRAWSPPPSCAPSSQGCRAPCFPEIRRRVDGARGALTVFSAQNRDRGVCGRPSAGEEGPQGRVHPDHLRHADHHGAPDGLLQQARPERRSDQDRRLGGDSRQDAQQGIRRRPHALADAAGDHARRRLQPDPLHGAGDREHQRPGHHACRSSTRTSAIRSDGRASSSRCRSTTRCTIICCATTSPSTASIPTRTSRSARCRRRRWWPTCAPTTSTASSGPTRSTSARSMTAWASSTFCRRRSGRGIPCCAFAASREFVTTIAEHLRGAAQGDHRRHRVRPQSREPQADRRGDRAGELSQSAGDRARADTHRHLRRWSGQHEA